MKIKTRFTCIAGLSAIVVVSVFAAACKKKPAEESPAPAVEEVKPAASAEEPPVEKSTPC